MDKNAGLSRSSLVRDGNPGELELPYILLFCRILTTIINVRQNLEDLILTSQYNVHTMFIRHNTIDNMYILLIRCLCNNHYKT